jgi:hypothetical protein
LRLQGTRIFLQAAVKHGTFIIKSPLALGIQTISCHASFRIELKQESSYITLACLRHIHHLYHYRHSIPVDVNGRPYNTIVLVLVLHSYHCLCHPHRCRRIHQRHLLANANYSPSLKVSVFSIKTLIDTVALEIRPFRSKTFQIR